MVNLDAVDRQLLVALAENARSTYAELGQIVRLSPNSVADRVRRLQREGVITGFSAVIDPAALGKTLAVISDLKLRDGVERVAFAESLGRIPQVVSALRLTGAYDYQLHIVVGSTEEFEAIVDLLKRDFGVATVNSRLVLREVPLGTHHLLDELGR